MRLHGIEISKSQLASFCHRHQVKRPSFFGSILRNDFSPQSDIDVLIEFTSGRSPSLLTLGGMVVELEELLGREIDLKTPGFLSPLILDEIGRHSQVLYAA
jgi:uncharacterized protein